MHTPACGDFFAPHITPSLARPKKKLLGVYEKLLGVYALLNAD